MKKATKTIKCPDYETDYIDTDQALSDLSKWVEGKKKRMIKCSCCSINFNCKENDIKVYNQAVEDIARDLK